MLSVSDGAGDWRREDAALALPFRALVAEVGAIFRSLLSALCVLTLVSVLWSSVIRIGRVDAEKTISPLCSRRLNLTLHPRVSLYGPA